jgi:small subunit ribosomal protein S7
MSRRHAAEKRPVQPDSKYKDPVIGKFVNSMMWEGKKSLAESILYAAFDQIAKKSGKDPCEVFHGAISNVKPSVEVRSRRVGGATYAVPVPVRPERSQALAIRWIIHAARGRSEKTMVERLVVELSNAAEKTGTAFKKTTDTHKMAAANQAFAHYRW